MQNVMAKRTQSPLRQILPVAALHLNNSNMAHIINNLRISQSLTSVNSACLWANLMYTVWFEYPTNKFNTGYKADLAWGTHMF